jgi:omega-6 fatty acid desaturase (delta-12 desaturase)
MHATSTIPATPDTPPARQGADLMAATRPFMHESVLRSWYSLVSTFVVLAGFAFAAVTLSWWPLRLLASLGLGLTMMRGFILFHDLHHSAIFRGSIAAQAILNLYGLFLLTPPRIWRATHNYHHAHTARTDGLQRGTYMLFTTGQWREATFWKRLHYRLEHHPLTLLLGYVTVFLLSFGLVPFLRHPRLHRDSGVALLLHAALGTATYLLGGPAVFLFAFLLPFLVAGATGAYLFYVQHYFEGIAIPTKQEWSHSKAALEAASYLELGATMRWFSGNIGYHHVHHLNPRIPFYRLPAAMKAIPELQHPVVVRLRPREIVASLRLKLWDPNAGRMVGYAAARAAAG